MKNSSDDMKVEIKELLEAALNNVEDAYMRGYKVGANNTWICIYNIVQLSNHWNDIFGETTLVDIITHYSPVDAWTKVTKYLESNNCMNCRNNEGESNPFDSCHVCYNGSEFEEKEGR